VRRHKHNNYFGHCPSSSVFFNHDVSDFSELKILVLMKLLLSTDILPASSGLKMEAVCPSKTMVSTYNFTLRYNPEDQHRHQLQHYLMRTSFKCALPFRFSDLKTVRCFIFRVRVATYPTNLILLDFISLIYLVKSTNCEAPHYTIFSSFLLHPLKTGPNILLSRLIIRSSLRMRCHGCIKNAFITCKTLDKYVNIRHRL
jgi:hypothetical protein